jgi:hypothetical protein
VTPATGKSEDDGSSIEHHGRQQQHDRQNYTVEKSAIQQGRQQKQQEVATSNSGEANSRDKRNITDLQQLRCQQQKYLHQQGCQQK